MQPDTLAKDASTQWRVFETRYAIQSIVQHPLLGIGLGNFYRPAIENDPLWYPDKPNYGLRWYIHNSYLWVWIDMGLLGIIPFIWVFAIFLVRGFRRWRNIEDPKLRSIALGFTLACLGMVISNLVAPRFVEDWSLSIFAVILGINELIFVQSDAISKSKKKSMQDV
jgi:O-antigen ligase